MRSPQNSNPERPSYLLLEDKIQFQIRFGNLLGQEMAELRKLQSYKQ